MTKRLVCFLLAILMIFSMTSCALIESMFIKQVPPDEVPSENEQKTEEKPEENPGDTEKPEENPGDTEKPEEKPGDTEKPEDKPGDTEKPEDKPGDTEKPEDKPGDTEKPEDKPGDTEKPEDKPGDDATRYAISYENMDDFLMEGYAPTEAAEGERVVLRAYPLMDATLDLYANGERMECTYADYDYWEYVFVMPACAVRITKVISDGFLPDTEDKPTIYLAGDSTVKTYEDGQFIAGWGQYLGLFFSEDIAVVNTAHGGRSSRSFINEGRLYDIPTGSYSFSQNGGNSIADVIKEGDYLLIQFGHNDDASKLSNYQTIYDRMVPLGEPDENGIYPVIPAERVATTYLPEEYTKAASDSEEANALKEIAKYGDSYYAYGSGTYKWYLKQYIDLAREKGAVPVLVTPVARVKFNSGGEIIGGAGLHGENFAYVEAVRQLAEEEDCLLIDLFADSKLMLETASSTYANYLMALKPNGLTGVWPLDYDAVYGNSQLGYEGIEATHYNKYGAFLQAAFVAEHLLSFGEGHSFYDSILTTPRSYVDPSNLMPKSIALKLEALLETAGVTNPNRAYYDPETAVNKINQIPTEITAENYLEAQALCEVARTSYGKVNVDDRHLVTNYSTLLAAEKRIAEIIDSLRPEPTKTVIYLADDLEGDVYDSTVTEGGLTLVATSGKAMEKKPAKVSFSYADTDYSTTYGLSLGGSAKFGQYRYLSFEVEGPCSITCAVMSSSKTDTRTLAMVNSAGTTVGSFDAGLTVTLTTVEITEAGTYSVGSAGSGMYIFAIIIEYFE